jgi:hypothetical protein
MKNLKHLALAFIAMIGFAACNTDNEGTIYEPKAQNISFEKKQAAYGLTQDNSYTLNVRVTRNVGQGAYTANYSVTPGTECTYVDNNGGKVDFADGQTVSAITLTVSNMEKGVLYTFDLELSQADKDQADLNTNTAITATKVGVLCDYNWLSAGSGTYTDVYWFEASADDVPVLHAEGTDIYRLANPNLYVWTELNPGAAYKPGNHNIDFHLSADGTLTLDDDIYDVGIYANGSPYYYMYYDATNFGSYCAVFNDKGNITVYGLLLDGEDMKSLYTTGGVPMFTFNWTEGYPY